MTTFEITTIVMLSVIAVAVVYGVCFIRNVWVVSTATLSNNIKGCKDKLADIEIDTVSIFQQLDSIHDDVVDDLRDIRLTDKLKELDKPPFNIPTDVPTALNGIINLQTDNSNKSTNYDGYDPTTVVRGKEDKK